MDIGCDGRFRWVSGGYAPCASDPLLCEKTGWLHTIREGEHVLADKGFVIGDMLRGLSVKDVTLILPEFL